MHIRPERPEDYEIIHHLITEAFASAPHRDGHEQDLVAALRRSEAYVPALALVAECDGRIVGHILFTEVTIGDDATGLALAPLAVAPEYQRQGVGTALMEHGHRIAAGMGYDCSVVLGSEAYYPRAGYVPALEYGIEAPFDVPSENFMVLNLQGTSRRWDGMVQYAKEFFTINTIGAEE